jgi:hypothetical protein
VRVLIAGGYGTFGCLLAREVLAATATDVVIAGRDEARATALARELGPRATALALDLARPADLERAARGCFAVLGAAGPFQSLDPALVSAAIGAGAHWLDIADDARWMLALLDDRALDARARAASLIVAPGLSSVPAISGALARVLRDRAPDLRSARVTLFIGNRNRKGGGAVASALATGFRDPRSVRLPFGRRVGWRQSSPDEVLLARELGLVAEFRVAFEIDGAARAVALARGALEALPDRARDRLARTVAPIADALAPLAGGTDRGCLQVEGPSSRGREVVAVRGRGQRLAILPCALALEALLSGEVSARGCVSPATLFAPSRWLELLAARGLAVS